MVRSYSAIFVVCWHALIAQGCNDANLLHDIDRRSRSDVLGRDPPVHDFFISHGWYITQHNGQQYHMPDARHMPSLYSCGTYCPIYLQGNETNFDNLTNDGTEQVRLVACILSSSSDCEYELEIRVRKCDSNVHYYLEHTSTTAAYCFDPPEIQDITKLTAAPKNVDLGHIQVVPTLGFENNSRPFSKFECYFQLIDEFYYSIIWYLSGEQQLIIRRNPELGSNGTFNIVESELTNRSIKMGFNIRCGVQVSADATGQKTSQNFSDIFFAGIKVLTPVLTIPEGGTSKIKFQLTVPVGCTTYCNLTVNMRTPIKICDAPNVAFQRCAIADIPMFTTTTIADWNYNNTYTMDVTNVYKNTNDPTTFVLLLEVEKNTKHFIWGGYPLPEITVTINTTNTKLPVCMSLVDPHMTTADGRAYENQNQGFYDLYRNTKYNITVQEHLERCGSTAYCTCGVRIQAGRNVLEIDGCFDNPWLINYSMCEDTNTLRVYNGETGDIYKIYTPIGTLVEIILKTWWGKFMNIMIYMSPKDSNAIEGLCGNNDGKSDNDIPNNDVKAFVKKWKLIETQSLFSLTYVKTLQEWKSDGNTYCHCPEGLNPQASGPFSHAHCSVFSDMNCYDYKDTKHNTCTLQLNRNADNRRVKRTTKQLLRDTRKNRRERSLPESSEVISDKQAWLYCSNVINELAAVKNDLLTFTGQSVDKFIVNCAFDVQMANDKSASSPHVEVINSLVRYALDKDPIFVENNKGSVMEFLSTSCVNNCSNNGVCNKKGFCECYKYFHDGDCGIDEREPPVIYYVEGHELCPLSDDDDCSCFKIYTEDLMHNFSCQISGSDTLVDGSQREMERTVVKGEYEDSFSAICCVPLELVKHSKSSDNVFTKTYSLAISNNGLAFSEEQIFTVYNEICQYTLDGTTPVVIMLQTGYCYIHSECVPENTVKLHDECSVCKPATNPYDWAKDCYATEDKEASLKNTVIIASVIPSGAVFVAIAIVIAYWFCARTRSPVEDNDFDNDITLPDLSERQMAGANHFVPANLLEAEN